MTDTAEKRASRADAIERVITEVTESLLARQAEDGHWVYELEADATIPAEYILLNHYLGTIDDALERKLANYLRATQGQDGGWPLYHDGEANLSATVKAYYALKLVGDDIEAPHMRKARLAVLSLGGAEKANVFTRIALALFEQVPWRAAPVMRVEALLLPRWFFFHMTKVAYWSRTVMVPLLVLAVRKPRAVNPRRIGIPELFATPPDRVRKYHVNPTGSLLGELLVQVDRLVRVLEPWLPKSLERIATEKAVRFVTERLNGEDGLGAIFPAMANSVMMFDVLGYPRDHPDYVTARASIDKLLVVHGDIAYCQPCVSPVWDTGLVMHALLEAGVPGDHPALAKGAAWLEERQVLDVVGDWCSRRPHVRPGGWAFQYANPHYPDVDDTAVVVMALDRAWRSRAADGQDDRRKETIARAVEWTVGMQSHNGGWAAFDADNEHYWLNHIPFADHGALLDPPSLDVSARCVSMLAQLGHRREEYAMARGLDYLRATQEPDGSWFGRWGTNHVYGTWSALCAFAVAGEDMSASHIRRAVAWLKARQRADGGWGEDGASYWDTRRTEVKASTPSQTAWALLALMAAGDVRDEAVSRGVDYLLATPRAGDQWQEKLYTAVGFPKVFYLRYHGYCAHFPLWALARYRNLLRGEEAQSSGKAFPWGM
ncbi:MAG: squalene--hopene cyclase [Alphaproteobacteria bacterium]